MNLKIIVFANYNYLAVLENWLIAINTIGINNYIIISLDEKIYNYLKDKNINTLLRPCDLDLNKLWIHRMQVLLELLEDGYDIIHSDADAIWLKNPLPYLSTLPQDMIFSQGTYWPKDVHEKWGFVLCCGFFFIKNNKRTITFFKELYQRVLQDKDDQVSCNRLLLEKETIWNIKNKSNLKYNDIEFTCSKELILGTNKDLTLAVLPHAQFQRVHEKNENAYIKHIISEKKSDSIINILENTNCLFIKKGKGKK